MLTNNPISDARRRNMRAIRAKDTGPELAIRRFLHGLGYRYRLHAADLPGRPDIVFRGRRKAIEVRGCFWHQHGSKGCRNSVLPKSRGDWWRAKLGATVRRDQKNLAALELLGWQVLVIWECEVAKPETRNRLINFLGALGSSDDSEQHNRVQRAA